MQKRYFIEVAYLGTNYHGFQIQPNAPTIQGEVELALKTVLQQGVMLTGSSRTDAGVHALQNFFHFDINKNFSCAALITALNALLPYDIAVNNIVEVAPDAHARFHALHRAYKYSIITDKSPFHHHTAYRYKGEVNFKALQKAATTLLGYTDFSSFSKLHTQVYTNDCKIYASEWKLEEGQLQYHVRSNRFLRGMVRALVATMLKVGKGVTLQQEFIDIIESKNNSKADFSAPARGLCLTAVTYPSEILPY